MNKTIFLAVVLVAFASTVMGQKPDGVPKKPIITFPDIILPNLPSKLACRDCDASCPTKDCITYNIAQTPCYVESKKATWDCRWPYYGLASHTDQEVLGGRIIAYRIQWFSGAWSGWYVPGVNDMDCKYNKYVKPVCNNWKSCPNSLRKMWSYFYDHNHDYIICKA